MTPPSQIAHYRITSKLGEGGMGAVWRATDTKLDRDVAVKVLPPAFAEDTARMQRFEREAKVLASLNHPNIAAIYGIEQGAIIMELVEGADLKGPVPVETAIAYARQMATALEAAHEKGIVHRDLKPANIKVTADGTVKLLDFGLAKAAEETTSAAANATQSPTLSLAMTQAGMILGTAAYMAPEQARGKPVNRRADIWAFGVVFYELLTGTMLFGGGETVSDSLAAVLTREPDFNALPTATPPHVRRLLERCLRKDPRRRLQAIGEARIALEEGATAPPMEAAGGARGIPRWWAALAALFALLAATLAVIHFREKPPLAETVHFQVATPPQWEFSEIVPHVGMALSPDGRQLALVLQQASKTRLWVQEFATGAARELAGTEGAGSPFWSPDSRSLGFFTTGKLKRIDLAGGPPVTVCDVPNTGVGGTWNRDGVILFGTNSGPILRVSQAGGAATPVTTLDAAQQEGFHARPWFLPDGQHFLFLARGPSPTSGIYLASLRGTGRKFLVQAAEGAAYAAPQSAAENGHLLFLREGTLMALPLDTAGYQPAGEASPVAEKVGYSISNALFTVSATGILAYRGGGGDTGETQLRWFDREGKSLGTLGPFGREREMSLSPDGKRVAVSRWDGAAGDAQSADLWVGDTERGVLSRFTFAPGPDDSPVWSPDGKTVAFDSVRRQDGGRRSLYTKDAGGGGSEQLFFQSDDDATLWDWSGDGRFLLYGKGRPGLQNLWVLPLQGDRKPFPYLTSPFLQRFGQFSPGAGAPQFVAYASYDSGLSEVFVQAFPASAGGKRQISTEGGSQPRWRRDGKELFYIAADGTLMAVNVVLSPHFQSDPPKALFPSALGVGRGEGGFRYAPSPDGKRFLMETRERETAATPVTVVLNWHAGVK